MTKYPGALTDFQEKYKSPPGPISSVPRKEATKTTNIKIDGLNAIEYEELDVQNPQLTGYDLNYKFIN